MVNLQCIAILQIFVFCVGIAQEIASTGTYSNNNFTWATNIPSLQFNFNYTCPSSFCQVDWKLDDSLLGFVRPSGCTSANTSIAIFVCEFSGSTFIQEVTILNQFNTVENKKLDVEIAGSPISTQELKIKDCDSSSSGTTNTTDLTGISTTFGNNESASCISGFRLAPSVNLTCEFDSSWSQVGGCIAITCDFTSCANCCNNTSELANTTLNYDDYLDITCCDLFVPSGTSGPSELFTCTNGNAFSSSLSCVPVTTPSPTAPTTTGTTTINTDDTFTSSSETNTNSGAQTEGGNKTGATDRMSEGDIAGTVLTCIFILECICLCVFVFALNYDLSLKLIIGLYVAGICLSIIGIFMSFFGSSTAGTVMNSVEIAGTVLGSVGITVMLGGIVMQALKGVGSKE